MSEDQPVALSVATATRTASRRAERIQAAMVEAVLACNRDGISTAEENSAAIRDRMLQARQRAIDEMAAEDRGE